MLRVVESVRPGVEDTRLRILAATRELYANKGSRGTTTREVAERAGVNEATLFRHFGTKGQLLTAMLEHYSAIPDFPQTLERVRSQPTIEGQLRELARNSIESMRRKEDLVRVSMAEELTNPEGHTCAWRAPAHARELLVRFFKEKVEASELCGEPEWLARVFMSLFFSFVMARRIWADLDVSSDDAVGTLVEIFLNGALIR
jgi:AcrR family transcriptional regulator